MLAAVFVLSAFSAIASGAGENELELVEMEHFTGSYHENFNSVAAVPDGFIVVGEAQTAGISAGEGVPEPKGWYDAIAVKYDRNFDLVWMKFFGGEGGEDRSCFNSVVAVPDGFVAVGWSNSETITEGDTTLGAKGDSYAIIVKYDNDGNVVWMRNFGGAGGTNFNSVAAVSDGFVAVGGSSSETISEGNATIGGKGGPDATETTYDAVIVKYDNDGNVVWMKNFGGDDDEYFFSVAAVSGGVVAVGSSRSDTITEGNATLTGKGGSDAIVVKYSNSGNAVWMKSFGGAGDESFSSVIAVSGGFVAVGSSVFETMTDGDITLSGKGNADAIIVKFDKDCNVVGMKNIGGPRNEHFFSVTAVSDGFVAAGHTYSSKNSVDISENGMTLTGKGSWDAIIVKFDSDLNVTGMRNFGGDINDTFMSVAAVSDGAVAVGHSESPTIVEEIGGATVTLTRVAHNDAIITKYAGASFDWRYAEFDDDDNEDVPGGDGNGNGGGGGNNNMLWIAIVIAMIAAAAAVFAILKRKKS